MRAIATPLRIYLEEESSNSCRSFGKLNVSLGCHSVTPTRCCRLRLIGLTCTGTHRCHTDVPWVGACHPCRPQRWTELSRRLWQETPIADGSPCRRGSQTLDRHPRDRQDTRSPGPDTPDCFRSPVR